MSRNAIGRLVSGVVLAVALGGGTARGDGWKAGLARATITPDGPMWMAGYASRTGPSEGVIHDLWAKALVLEDPAGQTAVLVSLDLCGISRPLADDIRAELLARFGLGRDRVALACSHTHTGPVVRENLITMYRLDDEHAAKVVAYSKRLHATIVETVGRAIAEKKPAALSWGNGTCDFAVNRRENKEADVPALRETLALKGPNDFDVPVLRVDDAEGKLLGVVFGYACHCTVLSLNKFSGDYAGFAQLAVERDHPGATALFVAGCGADQNPLPRRTVELAATYGEQLATSVGLVLGRPMRRISGGLKAAYAEIDLAFAPIPPRSEWEEQAKSSNVSIAGRARAFLQRLDDGRGLPSTYPYPVQVWRLGEDLTWVLLGGEVVVDYALRLKRNLGPSSTWVSAYCNDVMAYIPSVRVLKEGGYEGATSMVPYGLPAPWAEPIEEDIVGAVGRLVKATGR